MIEPLLQVALDLCAHLAADDRYRRLAEAARRLIPCDAIALLPNPASYRHLEKVRSGVVRADADELRRARRAKFLAMGRAA